MQNDTLAEIFYYAADTMAMLTSYRSSLAVTKSTYAPTIRVALLVAEYANNTDEDTYGSDIRELLNRTVDPDRYW